MMTFDSDEMAMAAQDLLRIKDTIKGLGKDLTPQDMGRLDVLLLDIASELGNSFQDRLSAKLDEIYNDVSLDKFYDDMS